MASETEQVQIQLCNGSLLLHPNQFVQTTIQEFVEVARIAEQVYHGERYMPWENGSYFPALKVGNMYVIILVILKDGQYYGMDPHAPYDLGRVQNTRYCLDRNMQHLELLVQDGFGQEPIWYGLDGNPSLHVYRDQEISMVKNCTRCMKSLKKRERQLHCPVCQHVVCKKCRGKHRNRCLGANPSYSVGSIWETVEMNWSEVTGELAQAFDTYCQPE